MNVSANVGFCYLRFGGAVRNELNKHKDGKDKGCNNVPVNVPVPNGHAEVQKGRKSCNGLLKGLHPESSGSSEFACAQKPREQSHRAMESQELCARCKLVHPGRSVSVLHKLWHGNNTQRMQDKKGARYRERDREETL